MRPYDKPPFMRKPTPLGTQLSRRTAIGALASTTLLPILVGCTKKSQPQNLAQLNRGNGPELDTLDPHKAATSEAHNVLRDLYECLARLDHEGNPVPAAAAAWKVSEDGLAYDVSLRPGLQWSNGDPLLAEHFVASFRRLVDPATAAPYAQLIDMVEGTTEILEGKRAPDTLGVTAISPTQLRLKLIRKAPYLPSILANVATAPLHPNARTSSNDGSGTGALVSNGAFTLSENSHGSFVSLVRNPRYRANALNKIDVVKFLHLADENAELRAYRANEIHITATVPRGQYDWIRENLLPELRVAPQLNTYYFGFNLDRAPFANSPGVRRALSLVIDRERLAEKVLRVGELPAYGWIPPGIAGYTSQRFDYADQSYTTRVAEAQSLLRAAGYSTARPLRFSLSYNAGEVHNKVAVAVASMWKEALGLEVALEAVEFRSLLDRIYRRDVDMFRLSWRGDYSDPYTFLQCLQSSAASNSPGFRSPQFDQLLTEAIEAKDEPTRRQRFERADEFLLSQHPLIPLYFYVNKHLVKPSVQGWYNHPLDVIYSQDLALSAG